MKWIGPFGRGLWVYRDTKEDKTLGAVWKEAGEYYATGPKEPDEDLFHAELGSYKTLREAQKVVDGSVGSWESLYLLSLYEKGKK